MKRALTQISKSPFTRGIEKAKLPRRFHQPTFSMYNGRTDPVEHVSQRSEERRVGKECNLPSPSSLEETSGLEGV